MSSLLYLHGLASSPKGRKAALLADRFAPDGIGVRAPDLNVPSFRLLSFPAMVEAAARAVDGERPRIVVGSSLGALVALALAARLGPSSPPLVLVAPALGFAGRWRSKLPDGDPLEMWHHGEERNLPVHRAFFEGMSEVTVDRDPPPVPVSAVMGTSDESVPFAQVARAWESWEASGLLAPGSRLRVVEGGDHGLLEAGDAIEAAVRERMR